jgi:hypothetical protein
VAGTFDYNFSNNGSTDYGYGNTSPNSELAYMYYVNLGGKGFCAPNDAAPATCDVSSDFGLPGVGPFTGLREGRFWLGTEWALDPTRAWNFDTQGGIQFFGGPKTDRLLTWAVRDGDVASPVPLPAAAWLLLSGLGGLAALGGHRGRRTAWFAESGVSIPHPFPACGRKTELDALLGQPCCARASPPQSS